MNNPAFNNVQDIGPIPLGSWYIGPAYNGALGKPQFNLTPANGNDMGGRPGPFLIHADNVYANYSASERRIVCSKSIRDTIGSFGGGALLVVP